MQTSSTHPTHSASSQLVDHWLTQCIVVCIEDYGWCLDTIFEKVTDGRCTIERERVNFVAKFDIDGGETTDLSLEAAVTIPCHWPTTSRGCWLLEKECERSSTVHSAHGL